MKSIAVVGGGIVGLATAHRLQQKYPAAAVTVVEKEDTVGRHQTGHNSGVLHAGLYYKPGSVKARLAVTGIRQMIAFCQKHGIAHEICGKLVVATNEEERPRLLDLYQRGQKNGLQRLALLSAEEMREIEPHVAGVAAVRVPEEGIVDYAAVCRAMVEEIAGAGGKVVTNAAVRKLRREPGGWTLITPAGDFRADFVVNCAGLHCDRVQALSGDPRELRIVPFRGEYYKIRPESQHLVRHLIYPVPDPKFPFLGVHFTRLIHGGIEAGPNAVLALAREGYRKSDINLADLFDVFTYSGFWRFFLRYPKMCFDELHRSFSKRLFCQSLQRLVPDLREEDLSPGGAGVRAQALDRDGAIVQDFRFAAGPRILHVLNAPSPGATASLAIGQEIVNQVLGIGC